MLNGEGVETCSTRQSDNIEKSGEIVHFMFRPRHTKPVFQHNLIFHIVALLLIVGGVVGVILVFNLEPQKLLGFGFTDGQATSQEFETILGQSRQDLIAIILLLFLIGGGGIATVVSYLNYANTRQTLEEVKGLARNILKSIPTGILTVSGEGIVTAANPSAEAILHKSVSSMLGQPYQAIFGEGDPIHLFLRETLRHGVSGERKDITFETKTGILQTIRVTSARLVGDDGQPAGLLVQLDDVTEWMRMETRVHEAQKLTALYTLSAGLSHELRNPLGAVDLNLHLLKEELGEHRSLSGQVKEYFVVLETELHRLTQILDNFTRYSQSKPEKIVEGDFHDIVEHVVHLLTPTAQNHRQQIDVSLSDNLPDIHCDPTQITQALLNVVLNALQAMPEGGICRIQAKTDPKSEGVELSVQDTGTGIQTKNISRLFDPFFSTKPQGSGLGLTIAHRVMSNHGGRIDMVSTPNMGTTVSLWLPAKPVNDSSPVENH